MQAVGLFINTIADALEEKSFTDPIASILLVIFFLNSYLMVFF